MDRVGSYRVLRNQMSTFDIVLFEGVGHASWLIKKVTRSKYSHVGMVVFDPMNDIVLCWESTTLNDKIADTMTGRPVNGVQLTPLRDRVRATIDAGGRVYYRGLGAEPAPRALAEDRFPDFRRKMAGTGYESNPLELLRSSYDGPLGKNDEDLSTVFCSELQAATYHHCGILDRMDDPANEYTPEDFSDENDRQIAWCPPWWPEDVWEIT